MSAIDLDELDESGVTEVLGSESRGVVVDFWSPWCAPCRVLKPHLRRLADDNADEWKFVAVNTEAHPRLARQFRVRSLPTLVWFRGAEEISRIEGPMTVSSIAQRLASLGLQKGGDQSHKG